MLFVVIHYITMKDCGRIDSSEVQRLLEVFNALSQDSRSKMIEIAEGLLGSQHVVEPQEYSEEVIQNGVSSSV